MRRITAISPTLAIAVDDRDPTNCQLWTVHRFDQLTQINREHGPFQPVNAIRLGLSYTAPVTRLTGAAAGIIATGIDGLFQASKAKLDLGMRRFPGIASSTLRSSRGTCCLVARHSDGRTFLAVVYSHEQLWELQYEEFSDWIGDVSRIQDTAQLPTQSGTRRFIIRGHDAVLLMAACSLAGGLSMRG